MGPNVAIQSPSRSKRLPPKSIANISAGILPIIISRFLSKTVPGSLNSTPDAPNFLMIMLAPYMPIAPKCAENMDMMRIMMSVALSQNCHSIISMNFGVWRHLMHISIKDRWRSQARDKEWALGLSFGSERRKLIESGIGC